MDSAFFHFWLADRVGFVRPDRQTNVNVPYLLPMVASRRQ